MEIEKIIETFEVSGCFRNKTGMIYMIMKKTDTHLVMKIINAPSPMEKNKIKIFPIDAFAKLINNNYFEKTTPKFNRVKATEIELEHGLRRFFR